MNKKFNISKLFSIKNKNYHSLSSFIKWLPSEVSSFLKFLQVYANHKLFFFSKHFEFSKNIIVKSILIKRGRVNRMFLHIIAMSVFTIGILLSPLIQESNPFFRTQNALLFAQASKTTDAITPDDVFQTQTNTDIRDKVITYTVQKGDTLSTIAKRFGVSDDTIKWANDLKSDALTVGDELKILPVTGIAHKVERGENVYTIAKKYDANAQAIVDYPFNEFANPQTFSLIEGQILIVPDGIKPEERQKAIPRRQYIATGPVNLSGEGFTWPTQGVISQFYSWYHPGLDIAAPFGSPIVASTDGTVSEVYTSGWNGGYGIHIIISGSNGYTTLYSHMSGVNVSVGQSVSAGRTVIGWIGMTGRTTGPHVHFEVRNGGNLNPMAFLK